MKVQVRVGVSVYVDKGRIGYSTSGWQSPGAASMSDDELLSWARETTDGDEVKAFILTAEVDVEPHVEYVEGEVQA